MSTTIVPFAYDNSEQRIVVEQRYTEAQALLRQGLAALIEAGGKFALIRDLLRHNKRGGFDAWIEDKGLGRSTVYRLLDLHRAFATVPNLGQLDIAASAAALLAAPSAPPEARAAALDEAAGGARITVARAQALIDGYRMDEPADTDGRSGASHGLQVASWPAAAGSGADLSEPAPPALSDEELGEIVLAWLDARVVENELPDEAEARRLVLRGILNRRADSYAAHWKSLRAFGDWPAGTGPEAMLAGVRAALAELAPSRRPPSWAGVTPTAAPAYARPQSGERSERDLEAQLRRRLARREAQVTVLLQAHGQALAWLKGYLAGCAEPDAGALALYTSLERAAAEVTAAD